MYELFIEGVKVDIDQKLSVQLTFAIDDIANYGSRETSFSKTIVLPGTGRNNQIFGFIYDIGSFNFEAPGAANIGSVFNAAQTSRAELRLNGLLVLKGVFRITNIIKDKDLIEYEGALFGELAGFIAKIGAGKLQDLDFSEYNHKYTRDTIVASWDNKVVKDVRVNFVSTSQRIVFKTDFAFYQFKPGDLIKVTNANISGNNKTYTVVDYVLPIPGVLFGSVGVQQSVTSTTDDDITIEYAADAGTGFYYPLIDYGTYSTPQTNGARAKIDYDYRTFRPALYVKEYLDKIFEPTGYTYESAFIDSAFFKTLIIPNNAKELKGYFTDLLDVKSSARTLTNSSTEQTYNNAFNIENLKRSFNDDGDPNYTYTGAAANLNFKYTIKGFVKRAIAAPISSTYLFISLYKNDAVVKAYDLPIASLITGESYIYQDNINIDFNTNDTFYFKVGWNNLSSSSFIIFDRLQVKANTPILTDTILGEDVFLKDNLPKNIFQKDFFSWILKMFNLYVYEDKLDDKKLHIVPYKDYLSTEQVDWTNKIARDKPWQIKPMGLLNGRFFEYKYKDDSDFYNEGYKKKYNLPYGSNLQDTKFEFAKDKQTIEIGFSPTVIVAYADLDKIVSVTYKKSNGNAVAQEERMDTNIRILIAKKRTGMVSWYITNNSATTANKNLGAALTAYGYAGHFDDPLNPTVDINFGASEEIYFDPNTYPSANLFNTYWSGYIAEIVDKDSKLLSCYARLTPLDIAQLDFSKPVMIDGVLFRLNKVEDYDYRNDELVKVELLKIINNG